ncbi:MAG: S16 family serine protease [Pseudomonadota bacterium]
MFVAITSRMTGIPIRPDVAMTGEITLRGMVLQVGGIKEKVLAAHRAGIKEIIIPQRNEKDLVEIPDEIKQDLTFRFIQSVDEALDFALVSSSFNKPTTPPEARESRPPQSQPIV